MGVVAMCEIRPGDLLKRTKGAKCVVKVANLSVADMNENLRVAFFQELTLHYRFRDCEGFARVFGYEEYPTATLIMQYYPLGAMSRYIYGKDRQLIANFPRTKRQLLTLLTNLARAYACMHDAGIVHQDVKPDNVLLDGHDGHLLPIVTDFGIARVLSDRQLEVGAF